MAANFINTSGNIIANSGNFTTLIVNGTSVSNFNSSVSGLLPVKNISSGSGINVSSTSGNFTISVTGLIANPSDNRILTSRDSTTTGIDAESALTFDGSILKIDDLTDNVPASLELYNDANGDGSVSVRLLDASGIEKIRIYSNDDTDENSIISYGYPLYIRSYLDRLYLSGPSYNYIDLNISSGIDISAPSGINILSNLKINNQTASTIAGFDANKNITSLATSTYPNLTELSYVKGVTSSIQTQLNGKAASSHTHTSSDITNFNSSVSGLLPSVTGTGYVSSSFNNNTYIISVTGLQPSGNYANNIHNHGNITSSGTIGTGIVPAVVTTDSYGVITTTPLGYTLLFEDETLNVDVPYLNNFYSTLLHTHGNITSSGTIGSNSGLLVITGNSGVLTTTSGITSSYITNFNTSVSGLLPTIANSGDNRILTSTGSSVGINGESNLTFDGTLLNVSGSGTFASGVNISNQTGSTIASFDANKNVISLITSTYPSLTELSYVKGVTSALQTQIDTKASTSTTITAGSGLANGGSLAANRTIDVGQGDGISVSADAISVDSTVVRTTGTQTISGSKTFQPSTTFSSGITISNQTANTIASFDASSNVVSLTTSTYPSLTELSYVKGVTSALQTQIDGKSSTSHTHGNITSAGAIGSTSNLPLITTTAGAITVGSFGSTANTFCQGNDSRLSDSRAPTGSAGGDLTGTYPNPTLTTTGVTGGTYRSVTVDTKGRITAGTNPTTLSGYGITDALQLSGGTLTGPMEISTGAINNNYNEGLRLTAANNGWTGITFGSTGLSGAPTNGWFAARNPSNQFIISPADSSSTTGITLNSGGNALWRNNIILHAGNYNSYAPTLTGGGASGTWGINITGNAATVTNGLTTTNYNSYAPTLTGGNASGTWGISISGDLTKTAPTIGYTVSAAAVSYLSQAGPQILGQGGSGAIITFHRPGAYAINLGLDTDNQVKIGGWSFGAAAYKIVTADSRNSRGATRLYRNDSDTDYSVQTYWTGARWRLRGYVGDTYHAEAEVSYADSAGSATSATTATTATNWGTYGGVPAAGTSFANANTIGRSDINGYTYFGYINSSTGNSENPTVSQVIVTNGGDNFYRKASIAHLTSAVQSNASGSWGINITGNAATATTASNVNNGTLTLNVSGTGLSGSASFTANQSGNTTFTVTSNATSANTASTIVARDASGNFSAGTITATNVLRAWGVYDGSATSANPGDGVNMGTMTRSGTATYTCNFSITLPNANYGVLVSGQVGSMVTQTRNTTSVVIVAQNLNGVQTQAPYFTVAILDTP